MTATAAAARVRIRATGVQSAGAEWRNKRSEAAHERVIRIPPERPINRANRAHSTHRLPLLDLHKRQITSLCVTKSRTYACPTGPTGTLLHYPR